MSFRFLLTTLLCVASTTLSAGQYNSVLEIGSDAPQWKELPGTDGQDHSMTSLEMADVVVVVFTCNSCPYAEDMEDRLNAFVKRYEGKSVALIAINVNTVEEDRLPAMKQRAAEKSFRFPYLWDQSQEIAKAYGAKYTPEFFVLDKDRTVRYMGAYDDSPDGSKVMKTYVDDAVDAILNGKPIEVSETIPIGCRIRLERESRKRTR